MSPALPTDLDVMSRPETYVTWAVQSRDGKEHAVSLYFDASAQLTVDSLAQDVVTSRIKFGGLTALRAGSSRCYRKRVTTQCAAARFVKTPGFSRQFECLATGSEGNLRAFREQERFSRFLKRTASRFVLDFS
jgi:hypothetical protein